MRRSRRRTSAGAAGLLAVAVLGGCASVVGGRGTAASQAATSSAPSGFPSSSSSSVPPSPPTATASTTSPPTSDLASLLAPGPAGSKSWGTAWARNVSPTISQFVAHVYPAKSGPIVKAELVAQGLNGIAHRTWTAPSSNQADQVLLRFDTPAGAVSRYRSATSAKAASPGQFHFDVPGFPNAIGYYNPTIDEVGDVRTIVYGQVRDIVMEIFFYSPAKLDQAGAIAAATTQLRLLPG